MAASRTASCVGRLGVSFVVCLLGGELQALEYSWSAEAGIGYTDNATRAPKGEEIAEQLGVIEIAAELQEMNDRLTALLRSDFQFATYNSDQFDDETLGGVDLALDYAVVPRVLHWIFVETYGQQAADPFRAFSLFNRENVNYVTTGPRITAPMGPRNFIELSALRSSVSYSSSPFDNDRKSEQIALGRRVNQRSTLSLVYSHQSVEYEQPTSEIVDFETEQGFARWQLQASRTNVELELGKMKLDVPNAPHDNPLVRTVITRELSGATTVSLDAGRVFADAGESFRQFQSAGLDVGSAQDVVGTADPFEDRYVSIGLARAREVGGVEVTLGRSEELFDDGIRNRDLTMLEARIFRQLTSRWDANARVVIRRREFLADGQVDDESYFRLGAERRIGGRTSVGVNVDVFKRDSTLVDSNTKEQRLFVTVIYSPPATRRER